MEEIVSLNIIRNVSNRTEGSDFYNGLDTYGHRGLNYKSLIDD